MNILFLGDSLIEYFDWQGRFPEHAVANLGVSGESVEGLLMRTGSITEKYSADLIVIMTGINNIAMGDEDFIRTYRVLLKNLSAAYPEAQIIAHSLLPTLLDFIPPDSVRRVNTALKELAGATGVEYLDLHRLFLDEQGRPVSSYLLEDGIHLSRKGYLVWADEVEKIIKRR